MRLLLTSWSQLASGDPLQCIFGNHQMHGQVQEQLDGGLVVEVVTSCSCVSIATVFCNLCNAQGLIVNAESWIHVQVLVYVDGFLVGEVAAKGDTPHHIIHRLCDLDMHLENEMEQPTPQQGVGFTLNLPELRSGRHEVRPSVKKKYYRTATGSKEVKHLGVAILFYACWLDLG